MKRKILLTALLVIFATIVMAQTHVNKQPGGDWIYQDYSLIGGTVFYVDSAASNADDNTGCGRGPKTPCATIDYAVGLCTGGAGDVIYVMPSHVEDGLTANLIDADTASISIIGLGTGNDRPTITYDDTDCTVAIGADNVTIRNIRFEPSISATVTAIIVEAGADYAVIEDCEFMIGEASGTDEFISAISVYAATDTIIRNNIFKTAITDAHCTNAINIGIGGAASRVIVEANYIYGNYSTAAIIDGTTACTELLIKGNIIKVKDGEPGIELASATTGFIEGNRVESTGISPDVAIVAADCSWFENLVVVADGTAPELIGTSTETSTPLHVGSEFCIEKALVQTDVVAGGTPLTGVSSGGDLKVLDVIVCNGGTEFDSAAEGAVFELYTDNVQGTASFGVTTEASLLANTCLDLQDFATTHHNIVLESGKKISVKATTEDFTSDGNFTVYLCFKRMARNATVAAP